MLMSVFGQGRPLEKLDHLGCIQEAVDDENIEMIKFAFLYDKTVLVGLKRGEAIIKTYESSDERLSFEALYDTCISGHEFRKMREQKVTSPDQIAPSVFELELMLQAARFPPIRLRIRAKDDVECKRLLQKLVRENEAFIHEMVQRFVNGVLDSDAEDSALITRGALRVENVAPAGTPEWTFLDPC